MKPIFTFIHVTDTHLAVGRDGITPFIDAVNAERFHPRPDVVIFGGDNINGNRQDPAVCATETALLKERLIRLAVPSLMTCHTHDTWAEPRPGTQYRKAFGDDQFSYMRDFPGGFRGVFMSGMFERDGKVIDLYDQVDWLEAALAGAGDTKVLVFAHVPLFPPRKPVPPPFDLDLKKPTWQAGNFYFKPPFADPLKAVIGRSGNVVAHYSGHCHVHSVLQSQGTWYVTTGALATRPWEYRYVEVFPDRLVHRVFCPDPLRKVEKEDKAFWTNCVNEDHPTVGLYHDGLPEEREFTI